jgi:hypothetical protein
MKYSKVNVLAELVTIVLHNDVSIAGELTGISEYKDNIFRFNPDVNPSGITILFEIDESGANVGLPTGEYNLLFEVIVPVKVSRSKNICNDISSRIVYLFNKRHVYINNMHVSKTKKARIRFIRKLYNNESDSIDKKIHCRKIGFLIICDDEIL